MRVGLGCLGALLAVFGLLLFLVGMVRFGFSVLWGIVRLAWAAVVGLLRLAFP